jgi:hypothetical protein
MRTRVIQLARQFVALWFVLSLSGQGLLSLAHHRVTENGPCCEKCDGNCQCRRKAKPARHDGPGVTAGSPCAPDCGCRRAPYQGAAASGLPAPGPSLQSDAVHEQPVAVLGVPLVSSADLRTSSSRAPPRS